MIHSSHLDICIMLIVGTSFEVNLVDWAVLVHINRNRPLIYGRRKFIQSSIAKNPPCWNIFSVHPFSYFTFSIPSFGVVTFQNMSRQSQIILFVFLLNSFLIMRHPRCTHPKPSDAGILASTEENHAQLCLIQSLKLNCLRERRSGWICFSLWRQERQFWETASIKS